MMKMSEVVETPVDVENVRYWPFLGSLVLLVFAPWWTDWVSKKVSFPYEVKSTLSLDGWDLAGERRVKCVLLSGDQLHHVGASDIDVDSGIISSWRVLDDFHRYTIVLEDVYSNRCPLDPAAMLLLDSDVSDAIKRDKSRSS